MKPPIRRTGTLILLAVLLAAISTGSLTICDAILYGDPIDGGVISLSLKAGEEAADFTGSEGGFFYRFAVCPAGSLPDGVYTRIRRDTRGSGSVSVDLVTDTNAHPGHYTLTYAESDFFFLDPVLYTGELDLTILPPDVTLVACFYAYSEGEILLEDVPIMFYAYCSQAPENNPIVQYKWWFNYNGNPNSTPDVTTTEFQTNHTYATPGQKPVRLVVRAQNGDEAATAQTITVQGL